MPTFARRVQGPLVALAVLVGAGSAWAQPSAQDVAMARELIELRGGSAIYEQVVPTVFNQAAQVFLQMNPTDATLQKDVVAVAGEMRSEYEARIASLRDKVAGIYATSFTSQELKALLAFYKSDLGRKLNTEEPKLVTQTMTEVREWANKLSEEVLNQMREKLRKRGHDI